MAAKDRITRVTNLFGLVVEMGTVRRVQTPEYRRATVEETD
jgi:hypothetical protein